MEQMTVKDAIQIVVNQLGAISVPRVLNEQIGVPIDTAIANLQACLDAINRAESEGKKNDGTNAPNDGRNEDQ